MTNLKYCWLAPAALSALLALNTQAAQPQFRGFISQSVVVSEDNPLYDDKPGTHFHLREIGLNGSWQTTEKLRFAGQILSRKAGGLDNGDGRIDFLLMDYNPILNDSISAGIRLGRLKTGYGLYNTVRDVPHARPGVFVPQSVYFESYRDALLSVDGAELYLNTDISIGEFAFNVYGGQAKINNNVIEYSIYQQNGSGKFEDADKYGFKLSYIPAGIHDLTFAISSIKPTIELSDVPQFSPVELYIASQVLAADPYAFPNYVTSTKIEPLVTTYSAQYNWRNWIFTGEYIDIKTKISNQSVLYAPNPNRTTDSSGYYLQAEWLASSKLSLYSRYEELYYDKDDKDGSGFALLTNGNPKTQFNKAYTIGARWYINPDWSLTGEYSTNEGAAFLNGPDDIDYSALKEDWDVFILQMSYHFGL